MIQDPKGRDRQHPLARAGEVFLFWIPVMVPLILLGQLGTKGLRPTLKDAAELEEDEQKLDDQQRLAQQTGARLAENLDAYGDEIYRIRNARRNQKSAAGDLLAPNGEATSARNR